MPWVNDSDMDSMQRRLENLESTLRFLEEKQESQSRESDISGASIHDYHIMDGSVTSGKIPDNAIETAKIPDLAVTTAKIADLAVTTAKIADNAITPGKLGISLSQCVLEVNDPDLLVYASAANSNIGPNTQWINSSDKLIAAILLLKLRCSSGTARAHAALWVRHGASTAGFSPTAANNPHQGVIMITNADAGTIRIGHAVVALNKNGDNYEFNYYFNRDGSGTYQFGIFKIGVIKEFG